MKHMIRSPHKSGGNDRRKRLVVGWFSFTCCEDSTILFTELLNDHLDEWKELIEFRHMKALKTNNSLSGLDVAFIEGAIWRRVRTSRVDPEHMRRDQQGDGYYRHDQDRDHRTLETRQVSRNLQSPDHASHPSEVLR
jgi:hypothetical protein